jgi:hypothetical protein
MMFDSIVKAIQYSRLVSSMLALSKDDREKLGLHSEYEIIKRAREMIYV